MPEYLRKLSEGNIPTGETTPITAREAMFETMMLGLRTVEGVSYADFERMHGQPILAVYGEAIEEVAKAGLLQPVDEANPRVALNRRGLLLQNTALMAFLKDR